MVVGHGGSDGGGMATVVDVEVPWWFGHTSSGRGGQGQRCGHHHRHRSWWLLRVAVTIEVDHGNCSGGGYLWIYLGQVQV